MGLNMKLLGVLCLCLLGCSLAAPAPTVPSCPEGQLWEPDHNACATVEVDPQCQGKKVLEAFGDPESTTSYYTCTRLLGGWKIVPVRHECPEGQVFNPNEKSCGKLLTPVDHKCPDGQLWEHDRQVCLTVHIATECQGKNLHENFATENTNSYYFCARLLGGVDVVPIFMDCPEEQAFNPNSKSCEAPKQRLTRSVSAAHKCPEGQQWEPDTQSCMTVHTLPECQGKKLNENFAAQEATGYYFCTHLLGGVDIVPIFVSCGEGEVFNPSIKSCEAGKQCPDGQKWEPDSQSCMTVHLAAECKGKALNENFAAQEGTGYYFCARLLGGVDVVPIFVSCEKDQIFNPSSKSCEAGKECPEGQKWEPDTQSCMTVHLAPECKGKPLNKNFGVEKGYYFCTHLLGGVDIVPVFIPCPGLEVFNPSTNDCAAPSKRVARSASNPHDCPEGTKWEVDTQSCMTVHLAPQCAGKKVHVNFADPMSPTSYYSCEKLMGGVDVVSVHHECPEMQGFNPVIKACEGYLPFLIGGVPMGISTTACQGRELFENFADTKSDTGYYFCMRLLGGSAIVPVHKECPKGQVFDTSSKKCL